VGGLKRTYLVHVPNSYDGSKPYSIVLGFHGDGSGAKQLIFSSGLNETLLDADSSLVLVEQHLT
jgi:polyhydroxybutyrate depolymerase